MIGIAVARSELRWSRTEGGGGRFDLVLCIERVNFELMWKGRREKSIFWINFSAGEEVAFIRNWPGSADQNSQPRISGFF